MAERPFFLSLLHGQQNQLDERLVIRKARFVLGDLLDLPMQAFDRICGIDQSPDFRRELEEGRNLAPVAFPGGGDMRIALVPFLRVWLSFTKNVS